MESYTLTEINIYPVKSLGGISMKTSKVEKRGLQYDRRWMIVDDNNIFFTQRTHPEMSLLKVSLTEKGLSISHKLKNSDEIIIPFDSEGEKIQAVVWNDTIPVETVSREANEWFSEILNFNCKIVSMHGYSKRAVNPERAPGEFVSFADAYPFLIIGEESLNLLNSKLEEKLPMNRFRPNLVFSGGEPHDEDLWEKFSVGNNIFYSVKPCARCSVTTVNQDTAVRGKEPLATLAKYRKINNEVLFGQNLICEEEGMISVGDQITILKFK